MIDLKLTANDIEKFNSDAFLIIEEIINTRAVQTLREHFDLLFRGVFESGLMPDEVNWVEGRDAADTTRQTCNAWKGDRFIAEVILDDAIGRACATLGGWHSARINQDNCFWKPPAGSAVGFHQDSAYEDWVIPSDMVSCWIALDDTAELGGTVEYIRGSHKRGEGNCIKNFHRPTDPLREMQDATRKAGVAQPEHVAVVVPAGGGVLHHGWTWHGSRINQTQRPRRSLVAHYMCSSARYHPTNLNPIYSRYKRFSDDHMDESDFPISWRDDGYRTQFLDAYTKRELGWGGAN